MASQSILFTAMTRGISVDPVSMPVSVYVSPRLFGDDERALLNAFPDWLNWTSRLKEYGLSLTFRLSGTDLSVPVQVEPLQPQLWSAMFKEDTLVRSHVFKDYSEHEVYSYSTRNALSLVKGLYQKASVELGLPRPDDRFQRIPGGNYVSLQRLVKGMEVNWNDHLRDFYRNGGKQELARVQSALKYLPLGPDGLYQTTTLPDTNQLAQIQTAVAQEFAIYNHPPAGAPVDQNPPDFDNLLDFHQALSSLNSYPELLRALGLVLDFDLPPDFFPITGSGFFGVADALPGWDWQLPTTITPTQTAYGYTAAEGANLYFLTLPTPQTGEALGVLNLHPQRFGLTQVDVDGSMHKTIMLAESIQDLKDERGIPIPADRAPNPELFDPTATLPALRSGGFALFADDRAEKLLSSFQRSKAYQVADQQQQPIPPFYADDLVHGYRLDIWDSFTNQWHSLHRRAANYTIGDQQLSAADTEGFTQLAAAQPAPDPNNPPAKEMYLHEAIARWNGWSLSAPFPGKALSSDPDPANALNQPAADQNTPATPFKMTTQFKVVSGSLPSLRFGRRYRLRARVVDICGNSLSLGDPLLDQLSQRRALPGDPEGFAYLRYEPVIAPQVVLRDERGVTDPGSQLERLVIRTYNSDPSLDDTPADLTAGDRHILPPRTSVELAERMGMLDNAAGKLSAGAALYNLLAAKDGAELNQVTVTLGGKDHHFPLESSERLDSLPFIPDVMAGGAALRDLPGSPAYTTALVLPGLDAGAEIAYQPLDDPNPRPGSATLVSFGGEADWQTRLPFRLALADGHTPPHWDAANRVLTVALPKGVSAIVPLSSFVQPNDLKLLGVWQWLREYIEQHTVMSPDDLSFAPGMDRIAHILQRAVEGGHWMLTPPRLLTLVHAVQQPLGRPLFRAIPVQHQPDNDLRPTANVLQTAPEVNVNIAGRDNGNPSLNELAAITAWRRPGSSEAHLMGGLHIHAASTEKVDLLAEWEDPVDNPQQPAWEIVAHASPVDEIPLRQTRTHLIQVTPDGRSVAYYIANQDLLCFVRDGDRLGSQGDLMDYSIDALYAKGVISAAERSALITYPDKDGSRIYGDAAPRHQLGDTRRHRIRYTARATSRYREYFPQPAPGEEQPELLFTRSSDPVTVDIPASTRPAAPLVAYVIPTFGWQRQSQTNLKRSVRFGGGLRIYLERPWFSSGEGELLGVSLHRYIAGEDFSQPAVRDLYKSLITQWGSDPIWQSGGLQQLPSTFSFPGAQAVEESLSLEEDSNKRVNVVGFPVAYDAERKLWYCDVTINAQPAYFPFVRLALVRYQPCALADAKISRVTLADFAQLTPDRAAVVTADPYHPRRLQITISGISPDGPLPEITPRPVNPVDGPTLVEIEVQQFDPQIGSDLAWAAVGTEVAVVQEGSLFPRDPNVLWTGSVQFAELPPAGSYRLLIREYEIISAEYTLNADGSINPALPSDQRRPRRIGAAPRRLVYAETIEVDSALIGPAEPANKTTPLDE